MLTNRQTATGDALVHTPSGLRTMPRDYPVVVFASRHTVLLPEACCPVSKNPQVGSCLTLRYVPGDRVLEVYSLQALLKKFVGGYLGSKCGTYPPERNMEGMVQLVAQMVGDALGVPVRFRACLFLDTGRLDITGVATPQAGRECP